MSALALAGALLVAAQGRPLPAFERAEPEAQGIETAWLADLGAIVQGWVSEERIVGAELLVIRNDRTVLHAGYGWRDREARVPMEPGGVFCLRSMTKAVVGTAVQMLIDSGAFDRDDAVAEHLPAFAGERTSRITVEQLTIPFVPSLGRVGCTTEFGDWRDVGGVRLPFQRSGRYASRLLGAFDARLDAVEVGVELPDNAFAVESRER